MAELGRKEAEQLIKEILTEYARKIRSAKKEEYIADVQPLFSPDIDAFYKLVKSEDMDFCIFNRLNDGGIRQLLVGCRKLAKCYELDSYGKIKDFTYEPESPKCRIASDSGGKYTAGGSYTFTVEGKAELGNKWYEPHSIAWHFYRENPGTGKYEETASKMDEARALADFDTWDRSFLVSEKGRYKVTATIFNQAITTGIRPDIVEVCELYFEAEERNIAALSCSDKIRIAMEYSNVIDEIREEIGDINILVTQMVIVSSFLIGLALTGYGAVAEALGFVLLAAGAAMSGTQLLAGIMGLVKFFTTVDDAKTEDDLKACGKIFGDAVAKIGVDGLFFVLSMFGLKKASARLTTRTVIDNGLNAKKWAGKNVEERELNVEELPETAVKGSKTNIDTVVRIESFTPPGSSKPIEIYTDGFSRVPKGKIDIYARGHVKKPLNYDIREEIRTQFKKLPKEKITKQMNDENAAWEREIHNYERALGNGSALEKAGIPDTPENNEMIAKVLCEAGNKVSENNTIIQTELCINENKVILESRWKIDRDKRPYMTTIIVKGVK